MLLYLLTRYVFRYRLKVVRSNLRLAFPDADEAWLKKTEGEFYHHFVDLLHESLLMNFVSRRQMMRILRFENVALGDKIARERGNYICVFGHQGNWDLIASIPLWTTTFDTSALYKALHNRFFDRLFNKNRTRFGLDLIEHRQAARRILMAKREQGKPRLFAFNTDQSPASPADCDWVRFFGIETPAIGGWATLALKTNMPVIYIHIRRNGPLRYSILAEEIHERDRQQMLQRFYDLLEADIKAQPGQYLWSHRRWKYKR